MREKDCFFAYWSLLHTWGVKDFCFSQARDCIVADYRKDNPFKQMTTLSQLFQWSARWGGYYIWSQDLYTPQSPEEFLFEVIFQRIEGIYPPSTCIQWEDIPCYGWRGTGSIFASFQALMGYKGYTARGAAALTTLYISTVRLWLMHRNEEEIMAHVHQWIPSLLPLL